MYRRRARYAKFKFIFPIGQPYRSTLSVNPIGLTYRARSFAPRASFFSYWPTLSAAVDVDVDVGVDVDIRKFSKIWCQLPMHIFLAPTAWWTAYLTPAQDNMYVRKKVHTMYSVFEVYSIECLIFKLSIAFKGKIR